MNDSLYLLPYRLGELKPNALDTLETRVSSVTTPIQDSILLYLFCPYARYALAPLITASIILIPILALLTVPVTLFVGTSTMMGYVSTVVSSPLYLAGIFAGAYSFSLLRYKPTDKNDYFTVSTPTAYEEWESMLTAMTYGILPIAYFTLRYFDEASVVMEVTGLSAWILSWIALILGYIPFYYWMHHRYGAGRNVAPQMATVQGGTGFYLVFVGTYMALVAFGVDILVYGSGMGAVFAVHFGWMIFIARRLRWTAYEDWAGFDLSPRFLLWGLISRVPLAFAVGFLVLSDDLTRTVAIASFSPLIASITYIGWRAWVTGDLKKPPRGWISSPGRKQYEKTRKSNEKKMDQIEEARQAIVEFNNFVSSHGISTVSEPENPMTIDVEAIQEERKQIHKYEARELTGNDFTKYAEHRDNVRNKLNQL